MLGYLKSIGRVNVDDMVLFVAMNRDLYELVGKEGYQEPFEHELEDDISEARRFINFIDGEISDSDDENEDTDENDDNDEN